MHSHHRGLSCLFQWILKSGCTIHQPAIYVFLDQSSLSYLRIPDMGLKHQPATLMNHLKIIWVGWHDGPTTECHHCEEHLNLACGDVHFLGPKKGGKSGPPFVDVGNFVPSSWLPLDGLYSISTGAWKNICLTCLDSLSSSFLVASWAFEYRPHTQPVARTNLAILPKLNLKINLQAL